MEVPQSDGWSASVGVLASRSVRGAPVIKSFLLLFATVVMFAGCAAMVGDTCTVDADCGQGLTCDISMPDGYCTLSDCDLSVCPDEGVCIVFDDDTSYCMLPCSGDGDCRSGYLCVTDFGVHPFCNWRDSPSAAGEI